MAFLFYLCCRDWFACLIIGWFQISWNVNQVYNLIWKLSFAHSGPNQIGDNIWSCICHDDMQGFKVCLSVCGHVRARTHTTHSTWFFWKLVCRGNGAFGVANYKCQFLDQSTKLSCFTKLIHSVSSVTGCISIYSFEFPKCKHHKLNIFQRN